MLKRPISYVVIALVAFIVTIYLVVISVVEGMKEHYMNKIQSVLAHITVDVGNMAWGIENPSDWSEEVKRIDPGIKGVTVGLETPSMLVIDTARTIITLRGIDLKEELKSGRLGEVLNPPDLKAFGVHEFGVRKYHGVIVGGALRKNLKLKLGDKVTFIFSDEDDQPKTIPNTVIVGFFEGKNPFLEQGVYIDREVLADKIKVPGRAKTMYLWLTDPNRPDLQELKARVREKMQSILKRDDEKMMNQVNVETWQEKEGNLYAMATRDNLLLRWIMGLFLLLMAFIIFLIFGRLGAEKKRDIGTLRALGASPGGVMQCFLIQGAFIGALGIVFGQIGAQIILYFFAKYQVNFYPSDEAGAIAFITLMFDRILITVLTLAFSLLGALWPAWRAAKLDPVECLRYE